MSWQTFKHLFFSIKQNMEESRLNEIREREQRQPSRPKSAPLGAIQQHNKQNGNLTQQEHQHEQQQGGEINAGSSTHVLLRKGERGFGFSIRGGEGMPLFVLRIAEGGSAWMDGRIKVSPPSFDNSYVLCFSLHCAKCRKLVRQRKNIRRKPKVTSVKSRIILLV